MTIINIRVPQTKDGPELIKMAEGIELFGPKDVETIKELWEEFSTKGENSWYHFLVAESGGEICGFSCYGRRPLTESTFDLYWAGVGQNFQGQGIGKKLLRQVEEEVRKLGGKLLIIETEGKPIYEPTRQFYLHAGCDLEARIRDFYAPGNDLFIFSRHL